MRASLAWTGVATYLACAACNSDHTSKVDELLKSAEAASETPPPEPPPPPSFTGVPVITIDTIGIKIGSGGASDLSKPKNVEKLRAVIAALPHEGKQVTLIVDGKSKMIDVVETVWELGKAGVPEVLIKTKPRGELPPELVVVPESATSGDPAPCSVTAMVTPKNDVGVWGYGQEGGRKHRPGFSGPDLSSAKETVEKGLRGCESDRAFFTAAYNMTWEQAYNVGATIRFVDKDHKIKKLILLGSEPVAGRPVKKR